MKINKKILLKILFIFLVVIGKSQTQNLDSFFIQYEKKFIIKPLIQYRNFEFTVNQKKIANSTENSEIEYLPNVNLYGGIGFDYKNFQIQVILKIPNSQRNTDTYGKTDYTDFNMQYKTNKFSGTLFYRNFKGFYGKSNDSVLIRDDIKYLKIGASGFLVFNKKFSLNSIFKQTQRQLKSVGSMLFNVDFYFSNLNANLPLFTYPENSSFNIDLYEKPKYKFYTTLVKFGYSYNFVLSDKIYISPFIFIGSGIQYSSYDKKLGLSKGYYINFAANAKLSFGYNGDVFVTGIISEYDYVFSHYQSIRFTTNSLFIKYYFGFRF